jgi:hypothetical protein
LRSTRRLPTRRTFGDTVPMSESRNKKLKDEAVAAILTRVKELAATADAQELARLAETQRYLVDESDMSHGFVGRDGLE